MSIKAEYPDRNIQNVYNYLDTISLDKYLKKYNNKSIYELMEILEHDYVYQDKYSTSLFDYVAEDEFIYYLRKRYLDIKIHEDIQITHYFHYK
ncbi:hypothetical protein ACFHWD_04360 [Clostridium sp. MT-14]|uniref:hypothetical protein n=1 Tax=Clostridium sp. MT-14 TaxID=3348360 RepID=UPI0035F37F40